MRATKVMDEEDLVRTVITILCKELGPAETLRFLGMKTRRRLSIVERHRRWQKSVDKDKLFKQVFGHSAATKAH